MSAETILLMVPEDTHDLNFVNIIFLGGCTDAQ